MTRIEVPGETAVPRAVSDYDRAANDLARRGVKVERYSQTFQPPLAADEHDTTMTEGDYQFRGDVPVTAMRRNRSRGVLVESQEDYRKRQAQHQAPRQRRPPRY